MQTTRFFIAWIICLYNSFCLAQTTSIPDPNFEQALIDMGIDSDGAINGQVLTSDINNVIVLDFGNNATSNLITNMSGIEDFSALEILDFNSQNVILDESQSDIFSNNTNLKQLIASNSCGDCFGIDIAFLDLSGLPHLELVEIRHVPIQGLIINNPDFDLTNLTLDLYHEGIPDVNWTQHICIEVDDPQAANNNLPPYDTWNIIIFSTTTTYGFDNTCNLSVNNFDNLEAVSVFPNPFKDKLNIVNPHHIDISSIEVYDISGQRVIVDFDSVGQLDVSLLETGIYFVRLKSNAQTKTIKIIKK